MKGPLKRFFDLLVCSARYWNSDNDSTTGAALAYFCAFSLAPLLVILLTLAGWIIGAQLNGLFGPATAKILLDAVKSSQATHGLIATATSAVTLALGATTVLGALQTALNQIWGSTKLVPPGIWGWVQARFLSFGFILTLGFLLLVSLTISTGLGGLRTRVADNHAFLIGMVGILDSLISITIVAFLFSLIFRYMPARRLPWKTAAAGGLLTAVLFDLGRWLIGMYLAHSTQPSAFGAAASFAAMLLWLYYTAQIFLFGAEFTACLGGIRDEQAAPPEGVKERLKKQPA